MSPVEAAEAFTAFAAEAFGPEGQVFVSLARRKWTKVAALNASAYPRSICDGAVFTVEADTFEDLLSAVKDKWAEFSDTHATRTVRAMALAIIRITADLGECSDAALRSEFSGPDVEKYGERACADANDIAGRGPFSIVRFGGANEVEAA